MLVVLHSIASSYLLYNIIELDLPIHQQLRVIIDLIINLSMKNHLRYRNLNLNEVYNQKLKYENHIKKIEKAGARKTIFLETQRIKQIEELKMRKRNTFINEMQNRNEAIQRNNIRILQKLTVSQKKVSYTSDSFLKDIINPAKRKFMQQTRKQNQRLRDKLKSLASTINTKKLVKQFHQTEKIKNRISRANQFENLSFYSKKYARSEKNNSIEQNSITSDVDSIKNTTMKPKQLNLPPKKLKINQKKLENKTLNNTRTTPTPRQKKSITFYNKDEIIKNKLDETDRKNLQKMRKIGMMNRLDRAFTQQVKPVPNLQTMDIDEVSQQQRVNFHYNQQLEENKSFFATQIKKKIDKAYQNQNLKFKQLQRVKYNLRSLKN